MAVPVQSPAARSIAASAPPATVAVIGGTGVLGHALARRWAVSGVQVRIGSRNVDAARVAATGLPGAVGGDYRTAIERCSIVVLTVPFAGHLEALGQLATLMQPGQILVDTTVPMSRSHPRGLRPLTPFAGSAAQEARDLLNDSIHVVSALHTVSAAMLDNLDHPLDEDVLVFGDDQPSVTQTMALIAAIDGLRPINAGTLDLSRVCEQLTPMIIGVNRRYKVHAGIKLTGLRPRVA
jgi:8-hydroxy-5-deazaflavin:NADPH oxidoreductase